MRPENKNIELSILIPAYNEEDRIGPTILQIFDLIQASDADIEVIVIDDGSIDGTRTQVRRFLRRYENMSLITHNTNRGKGAAIRTGVFNARGSVIIFTDADFSYPMTRLGEILGKLGDYDIIIGSRLHPESKMVVPPPLYRKMVAHVFSFLVRTILGLPFTDTQCGFKGFRSDVAREIFRRARIDGFAFDAEILAIASGSDYKICEIPVSLVHSYGSRLSLYHDALGMAFDLFRIRYYMWRRFYT